MTVISNFNLILIPNIVIYQWNYKIQSVILYKKQANWNHHPTKHLPTVVTTGPNANNNEISHDDILDLTDTDDKSEAIVNLIDPEEGVEYTYDVNNLNQPITVIAPKVEIVNIHDSSCYHNKRDPVVEVIVSSYGNRKIGFRYFPWFYTNHLNKQAFIKKTHCWINGMIRAWHDCTMVCIAKANDSGAYNEGSASSQLKFSKDKVLEVMKGFDKFNNVPVSVLYYDDIMYTVPYA